MILKRWALNLVALTLGGVVGVLLVEFAGSSLAIPPTAAILVCLVFMALFFGLAYLAGPSLFPIDSADVIRPEIPRQNWAWLRPRGEGLRSAFPMNKEQVLIGREVKCDVMLNDASVSREHAVIVKLAEGYLLRDLQSSNGTFVNGQRIQEYLLQDGDQIACGDIAMTFEGPRSAEPIRLSEESSSPLLSPGLSLDPGDSQGMFRSPPDDEEDDTEVWRPSPGR